MEARFRNNSIFGIETVTVSYDGEQWRTGSVATNVTSLVLQASLDGTNYTDMGAAFNFTQPIFTPVSTALDGNLAANRVAGIGGTYALASPVLPGATLYLRWFDFNDPNTDPVLGIDNFSFAATLTNIPVTIAINSPTNGQTYAFTADVPVSATGSGSISNVAFFVDGVLAGTDAASPYAATVLSALLAEGMHTLIALATNGNGTITTSAPVVITITPNQPPSLTISNGVTAVLVGTAITNLALITDDGGVTNVDWYVDGAFRFRRGTAPYTFVNADSLAGTHTFHAIVSDRGGLTGTSPNIMVTATNPPANFSLLVTNGSSWKYYASTAEPPVDGNFFFWAEGNYDDSTWSSGLGELGNGDSTDGYPETTTIDIGPLNNRYRTIYFRKKFQSGNPASFGGVILRVLRDDGAVVHLNGAPVWTNNILVTTSPITYTNLAGGAGDENMFQVVTLSPSVLVQGENTVAVEVHQQAITSSDLSFDAMIWGELITLPVIAITSPTNGQSFLETLPVTVSVSASTFVTNITLLVDGSPVGEDGTRPFSIVVSNLSVGPHTLVARGLDQFGVTGDSAPVMIVITANQPPVIAITNVFCYTTNSPAYLVGCAITNQYGVSDDLGVTNVDFYVDGVLHHRDAAGFGQVVVNDALAGTHTFTAIASDRLGLTTSSSVTVTVTNPPHVTLLLTNGASWKYEDSGLTQAVNWVTLGFDDSGWSNGVAELGFGDAAAGVPERTVLRRNSGLLNTNSVIFYFRKVINVTDPAAFTNVVVSVLRDDGARVYLNGNAVFTTPAAYPPTVATADDGTIYYRGNASPTNLVAGPNIVAVEVRQDNAGSSDISFDLMLWGESAALPQLTIALDGLGNVVITPAVSGRLVGTSNVGDPLNTWSFIQNVTAGTPVTLPHNLAYKFFEVVP
jgi:hypothetical protein